MDEQKHNKAYQIRTKLSRVKMEIQTKQRLLQKWEKNLTRKRRKTSGDSPNLASSPNMKFPKQSNDETDNNTSFLQITLLPDESKDKFEILNIEIPPTSSLSLSKALLRNSEDLLTSSASNDLLMINTEDTCPRKSTRIKRQNTEIKSKISKRKARVSNVLVSFPPFPNLLRDVKEIFCLPPVDYSVKDIEKESAAENRMRSIPSPHASSSLDDGFDFGVDPDAIATAAPVWTFESPNVEDIEIVRFWVDEKRFTILCCQRSYLSFWTKSLKDSDWNSRGFSISKINKDDVHKFDVFKVKDNVAVVLASKCKTTVRISLFSFPHPNNTEKITLVSENTKQILSCLCEDHLVYAFVDKTSTSIDLWRIDSSLSRLFRGSTGSRIQQPIHSLCSLTTTTKDHFVGISSSAVYIWNVISGSLAITICLEGNFTSIKQCTFATLEKGFLFLGALHQNDQTEVHIIAINPKTGKWKSLVTLEENQLESIILLDEFPTTSLVAIFSKRSVCLRSLDGLTIAKATLGPLDVEAISAIHLCYQSYLNVYSIAIGNTAGIISIYKLCV